MDASITSDAGPMLNDLALPAPYQARLQAARALAKAASSDVELLRALIAARDGDPSYQVRQAAAEALQSPVHRELLDLHPELRAAASAAPQVVESTPAHDESPRSPVRPLFPWLSIWLWPRRTIRQIVDANPRYGLPLIIVLAGLVRGLGVTINTSAGDTLETPTILIMAAILGPLGYLLSVYVMGSLMRWVGGWLGGEAETEEVRAAFAWSMVPTMYLLPLWLIMIAGFGASLFASDIPQLHANPLLALPLLAFSLLDLAVSLWAQVLLFLGLAEVHRFSFWRGLATWFLGLVLVGLPFLCLVVATRLL